MFLHIFPDDLPGFVLRVFRLHYATGGTLWLLPCKASNPASIWRTIDNRSAGATKPSYLASFATLQAAVPDLLFSPLQASANPSLCFTMGCDTACKLRFFVIVGNGVR